MEEYIRKLLEQVRFKKAHKGIEAELRSHMEDQIADNMSAGMDREAAEKAAVKDMGDPVEVGIAMDSVHRPRIAWSVVVIALIIGAFSCIIHELMVKDLVQSDMLYLFAGSREFYVKVIAGLIAMFLVYLADYTVIARHAKILSFALFAVVLTVGRLLYTVNGLSYIVFGFISIATSSVMLLYIPLYGAIIYKYRGGNVGAFLKVLAWMIIPEIVVLRWPSLMTAIIIMYTMVMQLSIAIFKGWFKIPRIPVIIALWSMITIVPAAFVYFLYANSYMASYQMARIRAFIYTDNDASYMTRTVRSLTDVLFVGDSGKEILGALPNINEDFLLTYLANRYGLLLVAFIVALVLALIVMGIISSVKSKNQLGLVMGAGCMNVLLLCALINVLENLGLFPYTVTFMPFFSAGSSNIVLSYIYLGIILSIYKYKDAYPKHVSIDSPFGIGLKLTRTRT